MAMRCQFCEECLLADGSGSISSGLGWGDMVQRAASLASSNASFPMRDAARMHRALCPLCTACTHAVKPLGGKVRFEARDIVSESLGVSQAYTLGVQQPAGADAAVAKLHCIPLDKSGEWSPWGCTDAYSSGSPRQLGALGRLADMCGAGRLIPPVWTETMTVVLPGSGYVVEDHEAVLTPRAPGLSLLTLLQAGVQTPRELQELWRRIPSDDILKAAVMDLLTGQCDRHGDNVFVTEDGGMTLIDNDQMLGVWWQGKGCTYSSMFLPGSQKYAKHAMEVNDWDLENPGIVAAVPSPTTEEPWPLMPLLFFDYRCHTPGGILGRNYPAPLAGCLEQLAGAGGAELALSLGFTPESSGVLAARAADLVHRGFEWTLQRGAGSNLLHLVYPLGTPCCAVDEAGRCTAPPQRTAQGPSTMAGMARRA